MSFFELTSIPNSGPFVANWTSIALCNKTQTTKFYWILWLKVAAQTSINLVQLKLLPKGLAVYKQEPPIQLKHSRSKVVYNKYNKDIL